MMQSFSEQIGTVIRCNRKAAGLSRIELADLAGVGKTSVYDVEHGKESVRVNTLMALLEALNISLEINAPVEVDNEKG